ncbi:hypothetical protein KI387_011208, partial [Taxus chinensis]
WALQDHDHQRECDHEARRPNLPWGGNTSPLALTQPLHELPRGSRKNFPKFRGDGSQLPEEHVATFISACSVLGVEDEDGVTSKESCQMVLHVTPE